MRYLVLRYFNAYGPRQRPDMAFTRIAMCLAGGRPFDLFGDDLQSRSFTYVGDVVRGTIREALGREPETTLREGLAAQWEWAAARVAAR